MKDSFRWAQYILVIILCWSPPVLSADKDDCNCPVITCGPCQKAVQIGKKVKFCSWGDINVCKKMICENVSGYFKCLSGNSVKKKTPVSSETLPKKDMVLLYEKKTAKKRRTKKRKLSSIRYLDKEEPNRPIDYNPEGLIPMEDTSRNFNGEGFRSEIFGSVLSQPKKIELQHRRSIFVPRKGETLFVGDHLSNPDKKVRKIRLKLPNGTVSFQLEPGARLILRDPLSLVGRREPFIHLTEGGAIIKVEAQSGRLDVLAGRALASIKSGQLWLQYQKNLPTMNVHAENQGGDIHIRPAADLSAKPRPLPTGTAIQWIATAQNLQTKPDEDSHDTPFMIDDEGLFSPIFPLPKKRLRQLGLLPNPKKRATFKKWLSPPVSSRTLASSGVSSSRRTMCQNPGGNYQKCAWSCENNPKGSKACQTQRQGTHCVRRTCNANGQWDQPTSFESPYSDLCPSAGVRVGPCTP